jgi:hypothetical protein
MRQDVELAVELRSPCILVSTIFGWRRYDACGVDLEVGRRGRSYNEYGNSDFGGGAVAAMTDV